MEFSNIDDTMEVMPFGKYKGVAIEDVPDSYLLWVLANMSEGDLYDIAKEEAENRDFSSRSITVGFGKFKDTEIYYLPEYYLLWLLDNLNETHPIFRYVVEAIEERGL